MPKSLFERIISQATHNALPGICPPSAKPAPNAIEHDRSCSMQTWMPGSLCLMAPSPLLAQIDPGIVAPARCDATSPAKISLHLSRRDLRSARQIHHLAPFLFEEIELAFLVIPVHESVDVILVNISALLSPVLFGNYQVNETNCFKKLFSLLVGEIALFALLVPIELIAVHPLQSRRRHASIS